MLVAFSGIDGAGKSTQTSHLQAYLETQGLKPVYLWSRGGYTTLFNGLKSALRRFGGNRLPPPGISERRQAYMQRRWVRCLWLVLSLLDLVRVYGLTIRFWRLLGRPVLCDRYLWDTLIDLRLNFPAENVERWWLWRLLVRLAPQPDVSFLLMIPVEESLRRSQEKDEPFPEPEEGRRRRYAQYQQLQQKGHWSVVIDATKPVDQVWAEIRATLQTHRLDIQSGAT